MLIFVNSHYTNVTNTALRAASIFHHPSFGPFAHHGPGSLHGLILPRCHARARSSSDRVVAIGLLPTPANACNRRISQPLHARLNLYKSTLLYLVRAISSAPLMGAPILSNFVLRKHGQKMLPVMEFSNRTVKYQPREVLDSYRFNKG